MIKYYLCKYYKNNNDTENIEKFKVLFEEEIQNKKINMRKVCNHDHLTGKYRGAAHSICNLNYQNPKFIPIVCHNLSGYDTHLFIKEFGKDENKIK
jgi:lipopolysaccharide biosynthesis regulator YciM